MFYSSQYSGGGGYGGGGSQDPYSYNISDNLYSTGSSKVGAMGLGKSQALAGGLTGSLGAKSGGLSGGLSSTGSGFYSQGSTSPTPYAAGPASQSAGSGGFYKNDQKIIASDIAPKRLGINFNPPMIIVQYLVPQTGQLYHHKMKLLKLKKDTKLQDVLEYLQQKHYQFFTGNQISDQQIDGLVQQLKKGLGNPPQKIKPDPQGKGLTSTAPVSSQLTPKQPLKPSNYQAKGKMSAYDDLEQDDDLDYGWNQQKGGSMMMSAGGGGSQYPVSAKYGAPSKGMQNQFRGGMPEEDTDEDQYDEEYGDGQYGNEQYDDDQDMEEGEDYGDDYNDYQQQDPRGKILKDIDMIDYNSFNLNQLSQEELQKHKDQMNVEFMKNSKRPGDPGYVYDKAVSFKPTAQSQWDDDDD